MSPPAMVAVSSCHHRALTEQAEALGRHLQHCRAQRGRWFDAALWAERMHRRLAPRFVTTLVGATAALLLLGAAAGGL
ncbi:MAG: hypothetical protein QM750_11580 [Rubrivivax sp.]